MQQVDLAEVGQKTSTETLTANGQTSPLRFQVPTARPTYASHGSWLPPPHYAWAPLST
jgi:hypothetical protein